MPKDGHTNKVKWRYGKASQYKCVDCGGQAKDWSQITGTRKGLPSDNDPANFEPRCRKCHHVYDIELHKPMYDARWTPERREAARIALTPEKAAKMARAQWTQEKREAKRQETIKKNKEPISDERRKKLSESHKGKPSNRKGAKLTDAQKAAISASLTGKKQSEETKRKRAESLRRAWAEGRRSKSKVR